ncbi:MAG: TetR family transcriptional regulator [Hyphomicrobiales bacterium]|nr:MAG: TetR family transcriptional regulator [Hyphomicrobiales bacterium]
MPADSDTARERAIRCGMEFFTEKGFSASGLDAILLRAGMPKGSFYHYFDSKTHFGLEVMAAYDAYFLQKLDRTLGDESLDALDRLEAFVADAKAGMARHRFTRGCLIGNLGQEIGALPAVYRTKLNGVLQGWQTRVAHCLRTAQRQGAIPRNADCDELAAYFWIGWEGAVLRARLVRSSAPLDTFYAGFLAGVTGKQRPRRAASGKASS